MDCDLSGLSDNTDFSVVLNDSYIKLFLLSDKRTPVVFSFANADINEPRCVLSREAAETNISPWAFDWIKRKGVSVVSIASIGHASWYRSLDLHSFLTDLSKLLDHLGYKIRYGYGDSMGAFGVSAFADVLKLNFCILLYPISSLNGDLAPFVNGYDYGRSLAWDGDYIDGAATKCTGVIIYDPLMMADMKHQARYSKLFQRIPCPGLGHGFMGEVLKVGLIETVFRDMISGNIKQGTYRVLAKKTRASVRYYNNMRRLCANNTRRRAVIEYNRYLRSEKGSIEAMLSYLLFSKEFENAKSLSRIFGYPDGHAIIFRDIAINFEKLDVAYSKKLMMIAKLIRPGGEFISKKLSEYEQLLGVQHHLKNKL